MRRARPAEHRARGQARFEARIRYRNALARKGPRRKRVHTNVFTPKLGREVQARLGQQLRAMYDEIVNQGVPTRFTELLNRLDGDGNKDKR